MAGRRNGANGILTPEQQMAQLHRALVDLSQQNLETRRLIPTEANLKPMILAVYDAECGRLEKLRRDAVQALNLLVKAGVITRAQLNEAVGNG